MKLIGVVPEFKGFTVKWNTENKACMSVEWEGGWERHCRGGDV
jgi:hypothetical protein